MLSIARATLSWSFGRTHELEGARRAAERTARLAPDAVETLVALGYGLYYGLRENLREAGSVNADRVPSSRSSTPPSLPHKPD